MYYKCPYFVNGGDDEDRRDEIKEEFFRAREDKRAAANGDDKDVLRAQKDAADKADHHEEIVQS